MYKQSFNFRRREVSSQGPESTCVTYRGSPQVATTMANSLMNSNVRKGVVIGMMNYLATSANLDGVQ